jgi:hypothetical protein
MYCTVQYFIFERCINILPSYGSDNIFETAESYLGGGGKIHGYSRRFIEL